MLKNQVVETIRSGEGLTIEFKECRTRVNRDVYESICAFLTLAMRATQIRKEFFDRINRIKRLIKRKIFLS